MQFPDTWEEFEQAYGFEDKKEIYTNGSRLIQSFRVKQWLDHTAEPEPKWIPVSEALPKDMDRILATIVRPNGEKRVRSGDYFKGDFMMDNGDIWNETDKEVIAWMPLAEPYRGE